MKLALLTALLLATPQTALKEYREQVNRLNREHEQALSEARAKLLKQLNEAYLKAAQDGNANLAQSIQKLIQENTENNAQKTEKENKAAFDRIKGTWTWERPGIKTQATLTFGDGWFRVGQNPQTPLKFTSPYTAVSGSKNTVRWTFSDDYQAFILRNHRNNDLRFGRRKAVKP